MQEKQSVLWEWQLSSGKIHSRFHRWIGSALITHQMILYLFVVHTYGPFRSLSILLDHCRRVMLVGRAMAASDHREIIIGGVNVFFMLFRIAIFTRLIVKVYLRFLHFVLGVHFYGNESTVFAIMLQIFSFFFLPYFFCEFAFDPECYYVDYAAMHHNIIRNEKFHSALHLLH